MFVHEVGLDTNRKGAIAEIEIEAAAVRLGVRILRPVSEGGRADIAFDIGGRIWRVQCKWGRLTADRDVVVARTGTSRLTNRGYVRTTYTADEVDLFGIYCGELDRAFLVPVGLVAGQALLHLRLTPARNGQLACINLAEDYDFDGAVAQLARASGWQPEGQGFESPQLHSRSEPITIGSETFRKALGQWLEQVAAGQEILVTYRGRARVRMTAA